MAKTLAQTVGGSTDRQISLVQSNSLNLLLACLSLSYTQKQKESTVHPSGPVSIVPRCVSRTHIALWHVADRQTDRERKKCDRNQTMLPSLIFLLAFSFFSSLYIRICLFLFCAIGPDWIWLLLLLVAVILLLSFTTRGNMQTHSYTVATDTSFPQNQQKTPVWRCQTSSREGKWLLVTLDSSAWPQKDIANGHRLEFTSANDFEDVTLSNRQREGRFRTIYNPSQV